MKRILAFAMIGMVIASCSDNNDMPGEEGGQSSAFEANYIGKAVGNFTAEEWYPGGQLGTTDNVTAGCYEDEAPAVNQQGLLSEFNLGETFFERNFNSSTAPFNGLGPASLRRSCIDCHPGYGHGKRQTSYKSQFGNGYLLAIYHPVDGLNSNDGPYISEVTGMPQTQASYPFLPPLDEDQISITWHEVTAMKSGLPMEFEDGEKYSLIYPEVSIPTTAFNTKPQPENIAVRLESTIGIMGTGLLDAITEDDLREQYRQEAKYVELNPSMWDKEANDFASTAWYTLADGQKAVKRFTYALTRASLQDGAGANAIWNITNVTRSDRPKLYTTTAWADKMAETPSVIEAIKNDPLSPYFANGTDEGIADAVRNLLSPATNQFDNPWHCFAAEMSDYNYYAFLVWHRGLSIPRARNLHDAEVQQGKKIFNEIGCATCHRPSWTTGEDNYWAPAIIGNRQLPKYPKQTIYPYTDMIQHKLAMKNDIHGSWCRTTPLWGRGLSLVNTGAEDRLHDCRARNEIEAIMWHGYSKDSHAYKSAEKFYYLKKPDRDAVVKFLRSI
ncbi:MAG: di-heme oxidoredictase family protein [Prevotella sp.]|nr:di-heme oxidoredictase family protein [Prevotella sp.]